MRWSSGCSGSLLARRFPPRWVSLLLNQAPRTPSARRELDAVSKTVGLTSFLAYTNRRLIWAYPTLLEELEQLLGRAVSTISSSHTEREAGAHLRLLRLRSVGLRLCAPQTERAEHTAGSFSDCLRAALLLTPPASAVRDAVGRAACSSCLGAAHVLAAPAAAVRTAVRRATAWYRLGAAVVLAACAAAMRHAVVRAGSSHLGADAVLAAFAAAQPPAVCVAVSAACRHRREATPIRAQLAAAMRVAPLIAASSSGLGAAQVLATPAASMRLAGARAAYSGLGAALFLAPPASAVRDAVRRAASFCRLWAALLLAPPAASMRLAGARAAYSGLGAALLLAPPAPAMRDAVSRATTRDPLGATHFLTSPAPAMRGAEFA
jgi:hypothetical protein